MKAESADPTSGRPSPKIRAKESKLIETSLKQNYNEGGDWPKGDLSEILGGAPIYGKTKA